MTLKRISTGSGFEHAIGYSRAVIDDRYVFISGTTGYNYDTMRIAESPADQANQCMENIASVLTEAGCTWSDVVRVHYILPVREDFEPCWPILKSYLGDVAPAATMIVADLYDPAMKIEIEVTARLPE